MEKKEKGQTRIKERGGCLDAWTRPTLAQDFAQTVLDAVKPSDTIESQQVDRFGNCIGKGWVDGKSLETQRAIISDFPEEVFIWVG